jgi:hypothetical protein
LHLPALNPCQLSAVSGEELSEEKEASAKEAPSVAEASTGEEPSSVGPASCPPSLSLDEIAEDEPHALESAAKKRSKDGERMAGSLWRWPP